VLDFPQHGLNGKDNLSKDSPVGCVPLEFGRRICRSRHAGIDRITRHPPPHSRPRRLIVSFRPFRRFPLYSIAAGVLVAIVLTTAAVLDDHIPTTLLGAAALLPLAAAIVDSIRLNLRNPSDRAASGNGSAAAASLPVEQVEEWLREQSAALLERERVLNARALRLQQWLMFPEATDFQVDSSPRGKQSHRSQDSHPPEPSLSGVSATVETSPYVSGHGHKHDPMAHLDERLFALIETKTHQLFDDIKADRYRKSVNGDGKAFDTERIRADLVALVNEVAKIYRPDDPAPLLRTNLEALSRAVGRASLRLLVAIERLPGGLAGYDFQAIYDIVRHAVKSYGMYRSARPYLDVASSVLFAGRIVSASNPITFAAWWAAGKATTYGASKLGEHLLDRQAVGLIRQLVEIVAFEVASLYSSQVRYRDVDWIYGVELVELSRELKFPDSLRIEVLKQLATLQFADEYGRLSLMRHLTLRTTPRLTGYEPARTLTAEQRMKVAELLEAFVLRHVVKSAEITVGDAALERWQKAAADRLEIQFRAGKVDASTEEQHGRAIWALAAFALEHLGDEVEQVIDHLRGTKNWQTADSPTRTEWIRQLKDNPPYLYHPPLIDPNSDQCTIFLDDLVQVASKPRTAGSVSLDEILSNLPHTFALEPWAGEEAIRVTAYFLRTDAAKLETKFHTAIGERLLAHCERQQVSRELLTVLESVFRDQEIAAIFLDGECSESQHKVCVLRFDATLVCFEVHREDPRAPLEVVFHAASPRRSVTFKKIAGYVRSDCQMMFPNGIRVTLPGNPLRSYEATFAGLTA
jgi:hypothetical protein